MRLEASIWISAPAELIWRIATDPVLAPQWNPNIERVDSVTDPPVRQGTSWVQTVRILGKATQMRGEVVEADAPSRGVVKFTGPGEPVVTTTIEPDGGGCRLRQVMDLTVPSGLSGMALRFGGPAIEGQLRDALRKQKAAAEAEAASQSSPTKPGMDS